jgi:hypothetical protein
MAALELEVAFRLATEYMSTENRKIERLHGTCVRTLLSGLPCYTRGRRGASRRLSDDEAPLTLERFVELFATWVDDYSGRSHSELGGQSPVQAFVSDPTPLRSISAEQARSLLTARKTARVQRRGVSHRSKRYIARSCTILSARRSRLRLPRTTTGRSRSTASASGYARLPSGRAHPGQQQQIISDRRSYAAEVRHRQRRAVRRRLVPGWRR